MARISKAISSSPELFFKLGVGAGSAAPGSLLREAPERTPPFETRSPAPAGRPAVRAWRCELPQKVGGLAAAPPSGRNAVCQRSGDVRRWPIAPRKGFIRNLVNATRCPGSLQNGLRSSGAEEVGRSWSAAREVDDDPPEFLGNREFDVPRPSPPSVSVSPAAARDGWALALTHASIGRERRT
jgi:hypothetical protein